MLFYGHIWYDIKRLTSFSAILSWIRFLGFGGGGGSSVFSSSFFSSSSSSQLSCNITDVNTYARKLRLCANTTLNSLHTNVITYKDKNKHFGKAYVTLTVSSSSSPSHLFELVNVVGSLGSKLSASGNYHVMSTHIKIKKIYTTFSFINTYPTTRPCLRISLKYQSNFATCFT